MGRQRAKKRNAGGEEAHLDENWHGRAPRQRASMTARRRNLSIKALICRITLSLSRHYRIEPWAKMVVKRRRGSSAKWKITSRRVFIKMKLTLI